MFRIDDPTAAASLPTPEAAGTEGYFTEGNPVLSIAATSVRGSFLNMVQEELRGIVVAGGLTPSKTTYNQVLNAIKALGQQNAGRFIADTGTANTVVLTYSPAITALVDGMVLWFKAAAANTGASTINVNGIGAKSVVGQNGAALRGGELSVNGMAMVVWSATANAFVLAFYSGQFSNSFTTPGYQRLPGGLIIQWGSTSVTSGADQSQGLPATFPTGGLVVVASYAHNAAATAEGYVVANFSGAGTIILRGSNASATNAFWVAIGY